MGPKVSKLRSMQTQERVDLSKDGVGEYIFTVIPDNVEIRNHLKIGMEANIRKFFQV